MAKQQKKPKYQDLSVTSVDPFEIKKELGAEEKKRRMKILEEENKKKAEEQKNDEL